MAKDIRVTLFTIVCAIVAFLLGGTLTSGSTGSGLSLEILTRQLNRRLSSSISNLRVFKIFFNTSR